MSAKQPRLDAAPPLCQRDSRDPLGSVLSLNGNLRISNLVRLNIATKHCFALPIRQSIAVPRRRARPSSRKATSARPSCRYQKPKPTSPDVAPAKLNGGRNERSTAVQPGFADPRAPGAPLRTARAVMCRDDGVDGELF